MPDWTDPKRPVYDTATEVSDGTSPSPLGRIYDDVKMGSHPNKGDLDSVIEDGTDTILEFANPVPAPDRAAMDTLVSDCGSQPFLGRHEEEEFDGTKLMAWRLFAFEDGGALSGLSEDRIYTYVGMDLDTQVHTVYDSMGGVVTQETFDYSEETQQPNTTFIRKILRP